MKKRLLSILLCLCMVLGLLPTAALAAEKARTVTEQHSNLAVGDTYYFDLSAQKVPGTINKTVNEAVSRLPDETLHYVPFLYAGTVNAYSLDRSSSGNQGASVTASANSADRSLFIAPHPVSYNVSWNALNGAGLVFGKDLAGLTLRLPSGGSSGNNSGEPANNEWDQIYAKDETLIQHADSSNNYYVQSWCQDTSAESSSNRTTRGGNGSTQAARISIDTAQSQLAYRPVIDAGTAALGVATLNLNGGSLGGSQASIKLAYVGATYTAPSATGLTRPAGNTGTYLGWMGDNGILYLPGASVASTVKTLTAIWTESIDEQYTLTTGTVYYLNLSAIDFVGKDGSRYDSVYAPFTFVGTVNAYNLDASSNGNITASVEAAKNRTPRSLFLAKNFLTSLVTWDNLHDAGLVYGKQAGDYLTLRLPSGGSSMDSSEKVSPADNEISAILNKGYSVSDAAWAQDTAAADATYRAYVTAKGWNNRPSSERSGYLPVLQVDHAKLSEKNALTPIVFDLNGGWYQDTHTLKTQLPSVCFGDSYVAPERSQLFAPNGIDDDYFAWNTVADGTGKTYLPGHAVPKTVTTLYAQWTDAKSVPEAYALTLGATYFFDLSGKKDKLGTLNSALPDSTLRYVPFTYAGTINAYVTANTTAYDHSLLIADYVLGTGMTGNSISGTTLQSGAFTMRLPTGGKSQSSVQKPADWSSGVQYKTTPGDNEWSRIRTKNSGYIKNTGLKSWCVEQPTSGQMVARGATLETMSATTANAAVGYRPVLEISSSLTSDKVKQITLNLNGGKLGTYTSLNMVYTTDYQAPDAAAFTSPDGTPNSFSNWNTKADGSGTSYQPNAAVPNTVQTLYAIWNYSEQFSLPVNETYYLDLSGVDTGFSWRITTEGINGQPVDAHYLPFKFAGKITAYTYTAQTQKKDAYPHSLFIADFAHNGSAATWNALNTKQLLFGTSTETGNVSYTLRSLSGRDKFSDNEWDALRGKSFLWLKYTSNFNCWIQDTYESDWNFTRNLAKPTVGASNIAISNTTAAAYWLPALEVVGDGLTYNVLQAITLNLNGGTVCGVSDPIKTVVAFKNGAYPAPNTSGIAGKTMAAWKDSDGNYYKAGELVPASVTTLTATEVYPVELSPDDIVFEAKTATYDGTPQKHEGAVLKETITPGANHSWSYQYEGTGGTSYPISATAPTDVGTYQVTAAYQDDSHYGSASTTLTITQRTPVPTITTLPTKTFDGQPATNPVLAVDHSDGTPTVSWYKGSGELSTAPTDAGAYTVKVALPATNNCAAATVEGDFTIARCSLASASVTPASGEYPYTGQAVLPTVTVKMTLSGAETKLVAEQDYGLSSTENTSVGMKTLAITGTGNYEGSPTQSVTFTIVPATPTVTTWPAASDIVYGQTLEDSTLSGGVASVAGAFAFTAPATEPSAVGTASYGVTFTPTDATNYKSVTGTVFVTVTQTATSVSSWPTASAINLGQTLERSTLNGGAAAVAGAFAFTAPATKPSAAGTVSYKVTFTPTDTNYASIEGETSVTVNPVTPTVTAPTASALTYGQTLNDSTLTGGTANNPNDNSAVSGSWMWVAGTTSAATGSYKAKFTPTDTTSYLPGEVDVAVTVNPATPSISIHATPNAPIAEQTVTISATVKNPNNAALNDAPAPTLTYQIDSGTETTVVENSFVLPLGTAVGTTITIKAATQALDGKYAVGEKIITLTVADKIDISGSLTLAMDGWVYGGTAATPVLGGYTADGTATIAYTYSGTAITGSEEVPTKAGSYMVTASYVDNTQQGSKTANFTIAKATSDPDIDDNKGNNVYTYGDVITLTATPVILLGVESNPPQAAPNTVDFYYQKSATEFIKLNTSSVAVDGTSGTASFGYNTTAKTLPIGTSTIIAAYGGSDVLESAFDSMTVTLNAKTLTGAVAANTTKTYDGTADFSDVAVTLDGVETGDSITTATTASLTASSKNAGSGLSVASCTVAALEGDNAAWYAVPTSLTGTVAITPKSITVATATVSDKEYDGNTTATVTAVTLDGLVSGESLTLGNDYTAAGVFTWAAVSDGVTANVTVTLTATTAAGNYTFATDAASKTTATAAITAKAISGTPAISLGSDANSDGISDTGDTLQVTGVTPDGATLTYSWKLDGGEVGTDATYTVAATDAGKLLTVTVTGTGNYSGELTSTSYKVGARALAGTVAITGDTTVGSVLTAALTSTAGTPAMTTDYRVQWYRTVNDTETAISGATSLTYTLTNADLGATLKAALIADVTGSAFSGTVTSSGTDIPAIAPSAAVITATAGSGKVTLSWSAPFNGGSAITGYKLYVKEGSKYYGTATDLAASATNYEATSLTNGTVYTFKLETINTVGVTASAEATATPAAQSSGGGGGSTSNTTTDKVTNPDGSTTVTDTTTKPDGTKETVETTTNTDGTKEAATSTEKKQPDGSTVTTETTVTTDAKGNSTSASSTVTTDSATGTVTVPADVIETLAKTEGATLNIQTPNATLELDSAALQALTSQGGKTPALVITPVPFEKLPEKAQSNLEEATTYSFDVNGGGLNFGSGTVTVTLDYTRKAADTVVAVYYVDDNGNMTKMPGATFKTGKVTYKTNHFSLYAVTEEAMSFTDVNVDAYYADAVLWAVEKGVTSGTSATTFNPNGICTRAQTVTFLWRAMGSPEPTATVNPFTDVSADAYYYKAVLWAVEKGITSGTTATTFSPDAVCSRSQVVTFLWRAEGKPATTGSNPFADVSGDAYYAEAVLWAVENGITGGTGATTFSPVADCTRAQIVTFLYRCLSK